MNPETIKKIYRNFVKNTMLLTIAMSVVYVLLQIFLPETYLSPAIPFVLFFFLIVTLAIFYFQLKASVAKTSRFANFFMLATAGKLLIFLTIIISYSFIVRTDAINFIVAFFIIYLGFTVFEVIQILKIQNTFRDLNK